MNIRPKTVRNWSICLLLVCLTIYLFVPPAAASIYFVKGKQQLRAGQYRQAVTSYKRAVRLKPNMARAYVDLGDAYLHLNRYNEAADAFRQALRIEDESCAHCGLGWAHHGLGQYEQSLAAFKQSVKANPNDSCPHKGLGRDYYDLGRYEESVDSYAQAVRLEPRNAETRYSLGLAQLASGDRRAALAQYEVLKTLDQDWANKLSEAFER